MYEEERDWFPELRQKVDATMQAKITRRYREEIQRYMSVEVETAS